MPRSQRAAARAGGVLSIGARSAARRAAAKRSGMRASAARERQIAQDARQRSPADARCGCAIYAMTCAMPFYAVISGHLLASHAITAGFAAILLPIFLLRQFSRWPLMSFRLFFSLFFDACSMISSIFIYAIFAILRGYLLILRFSLAATIAATPCHFVYAIMHATDGASV